MKKLFLIAAMFVIAVFCPPLAQSQTAGTNLMIHAHWDTGAAVQGVVTLNQVYVSGPATTVATKNLSKNGEASFQAELAANSLYSVMLKDSAGTTLLNFPLTTALINPANLQEAGITLVFNSTTNSVKSASVKVDMGF